MEIFGRRIGPDQPPYVVAEIGAGHKGDLSVAISLVRDAWRAGADAVKLQTYRPGAIALKGGEAPFMIDEGPWRGRSLYELYEKGHTPWGWHEDLFDEARRLGITIFSSPFDPEDVRFLESLGCPAYKVASCEVEHMDLLEAIRLTKKPVILSTGMANEHEITQAVEALYGRSIALLHCVSGYPVPLGQANIWRVAWLKGRFPSKTIGYSDHTTGRLAASLAVGQGASIIEKHIGAPDSLDGEYTMDSIRLSALTRDVRDAWDAMRRVEPRCEGPTRRLRRSIHVKAPIRAGETLTRDNLCVVRPATGCDACDFGRILGKTALRAMEAGSPLAEGSFE